MAGSQHCMPTEMPLSVPLVFENAHVLCAVCCVLCCSPVLRYYGQSKPWPGRGVRRHMGYLTAEQALAGDSWHAEA